MSLSVMPCENPTRTGVLLPLDGTGWFPTGTLTHYVYWANLKAHELAGVASNVNDPGNWFYKLANCLIHEQAPDGHVPASGREDDILATAFALLTLEQVTPEPPPPPEVEGRMTGGGGVLTTAGVRVTHGFELHCDAVKPPNNLQVNWARETGSTSSR